MGGWKATRTHSKRGQFDRQCVDDDVDDVDGGGNESWVCGVEMIHMYSVNGLLCTENNVQL